MSRKTPWEKRVTTQNVLLALQAEYDAEASKYHSLNRPYDPAERLGIAFLLQPMLTRIKQVEVAVREGILKPQKPMLYGEVRKAVEAMQSWGNHGELAARFTHEAWWHGAYSHLRC